MTKRRRKSKKWIGVALFLVLLVVAGVICFLVFESYFKEEEVAPEPEMPVVVEPEEEKDETEEIVARKEEIVQYEGENPNKADNLTGVVTYAGVNDGVLRVRVNIDQYLAEGSCSLALVRGGATIYTEEAGIIDSAATATCEGFDVPVSGFSSGMTQIVITISSGGKTGIINGEVNL